MKKIRVLSLDGGGIRGIIPATVLRYVEDKLQEITNNPNARLADFFDIIAGTSTGGILSCLYLTPNQETGSNKPNAKFTAVEAVDFYVARGYEIFNASKENKWFGLRDLFNANQFKPDNLEKIFHEKFGDLKLSELLKPCLITTYNMKTKTAFFFNSADLKINERDFYVKDVARSTSAAPTYFEPAVIKNLINGDTMVNIDGGVFANNPSMCCYAECRHSNFPQLKKPTAKDMLILSIGTGGGQFELPVVEKSKSWNILNWAKSIPDVMMDGAIDAVDYQMQRLFGTLNNQDQKNYKRIDVPIDKRSYSGDMSNASPDNIKALQTAGEEALKSALSNKEDQHSLDDFIKLLVENTP